MKYFRVNYLLDVIRSSLFLAVNGGGLVVNVCLIRLVIVVYWDFLTMHLVVSIMILSTRYHDCHREKSLCNCFDNL